MPTGDGSSPPSYDLSEAPPGRPRYFTWNSVLSEGAAIGFITERTTLALAAFEVDPSHGGSESPELFRRLRDRIADPDALRRVAPPLDQALLVHLAVRAAGTRDGGRAAISLLVHQGGLKHAFEVLVRLHEITLTMKSAKAWIELNGERAFVPWALAFSAEQGDTNDASRLFLETGGLVGAASAGDRAAARAIVADRFERLPPPLQNAAAMAFADPPWAEHVCRAALESGTLPPYDAYTLLRDEALARAFVARFASELLGSLHSHRLGRLFEGLPVSCVEDLFLELLATARKASAGRTARVRSVIAWLACIGAARSARELALSFGDKALVATASRYFERFPELGLAHLGDVAKKRGKKWEPARAALAKLERGATAVDLPFAEPSRWPSILRDAPWRVERPPVARLELEPIEVPEVKREDYAPPLEHKPGDEAAALAKIRESPTTWAPEHGLMRVSPEALRELFLEHGPRWSMRSEFLGAVLARLGDEATSVGIRVAIRSKRTHRPLLTRVRSVRAARALAELYVDKPSERRTILPALEREAATVALALLPAAFGEDGKKRFAAELLLHRLRRSGHELELRRMAARYGEEATEALDALLREDPARLHPPPRERKKDPFPLPADLPPLVLAERTEVLDEEAVARVAEMLRLSDRGLTYAGLRELRAALTPESADAFAWALFASWELAGTPKGGEWTLFALGHLGGEACAARLESRIRDWPKSRGGVQRMKLALEVLALDGSVAALVQLRNAGQRSRYADDKAIVNDMLSEVARARGQTLDELHDRLVPTLGLERGPIVLDYGPRRFEVHLRENLDPFVVSDEGERRDAPPRPRKSDDAEKAAIAKARWKAFVRELGDAVGGQLRHFERAMRCERVWTSHDFHAVLASHPVLGVMVRGLVWSADGQLLRVDGDARFATVDDDPIERSAPLRLAHPARDDADAMRRMGEVFADYELLQPFAQLGREIFVPGDGALESIEGKEIHAKRLLALLESDEWRREGRRGYDAKVLACSLEGGLVAYLDVSPGVTWSRTSSTRHTLGHIRLVDAGGAEASFGALSGVAYSELVRDLVQL